MTRLPLHPTVHRVVTGGALSADGRRFGAPPREKGFLLHVRTLAEGLSRQIPGWTWGPYCREQEGLCRV